MDAPTTAEIRQWAIGGDPAEPIFDFAAYGYPAPEPPDPDALDRIVAGSIAYVEAMLCDTPLSAIPDGKVELGQDAILMRVQQRVGSGSRLMVRRAVSGNAGIKSFRAGDYSETRFDAADAAKALLVNPWPELSSTLWALMTPDCRERWRQQLTGKPTPAAVATDIEVGSGHGTYGYPLEGMPGAPPAGWDW